MSAHTDTVALRRALRRLRDAAINWVNHLPCEPKDQRDSEFRAIDRELQQAALHFARVKKA